MRYISLNPLTVSQDRLKEFQNPLIYSITRFQDTHTPVKKAVPVINNEG